MLNRQTIRDLLDTAPDNVLSLYLYVNPGYRPNQNEPPGWHIHVKNALRDVSNSLEDHAFDWQDIQARTEAFIEGYTPSGKSLVLFVGEDGYLESYDLPVVIDNRYAFGDIDVVPLLWALDEYERYLVVLVDSEQARFLSAYLGRATTSDEMTIDFDDYDFGNLQFIHANSDGMGQQGSGGDNFDAMKSEHVRRFHNDVATEIGDLMRAMNAERIILGGNEQAAHQVQRLLHGSLKNKVIDILAIPVSSNDSDVSDAIENAALAYEREQEMALVESVIDLAKANGRGELDPDVIEDALDRQQVELLILPYPMEDEARAADLTLRALKSGAEIELVHGNAAERLTQEAPLAVRLYYAINKV